MGGVQASDWRFWAILIALVVVLYVARPYMHRFIRSVFFGLSFILSRLAAWLASAGALAYQRYCETVAAHMAEEYQHTLVGHEQKLGVRMTQQDETLYDMVNRLDVSAQELEGAAANLNEINLPESTVEAVRTSLAESVDANGRNKLTKTVTDVKRAVSTEIQTIRPQLATLRSQLKPISENADKLRDTGRKIADAGNHINQDLARFEEIVRSEDRVAVAQKQSIIIPWILSGLVMTIALTGVFLNFFLIQRPMAEIVGDDLQVAGLSLPTAAALVVIFLEAVAGIVLMDAAGVTRLTLISHLGKQGKRVLFISAAVFLAAFSFFEAILAVQREALIALDQQTQQLAISGLATEAGEAAAEDASGPPLTMIAQMTLAILIPWLLAIAAIPLETFVRNLVLMAHLVWHQLLMIFSFLFKVLSTTLKTLGVFVLRFYDLLIFLPLSIENMIRSLQRANSPPQVDRLSS